MNHDLTVGKPTSVLIKFCLPLLGSMVFQQMYNLADSLIVGKYIGENALAAVGNSYEITFLYISFAFGVNVGCSVIAGQFFGAKRYDDVKTTIFTTFFSGSVLCAVLMTAGLLFTGNLLQMIHTPQSVFSDSALYLRIYTLGLPFLFFYNISTGIFSALGDSRTPFLFLAMSSCGNVLADIVFVNVFHMGVSGVAWATFLCQLISCVLSIIVILRRLKQIPSEGNFHYYSKDILKKIWSVAIPTIFQQCFVSVGNILVQGVINSFGTAVMAGYSAAHKISNLVTSSFTTMGNGIASYTAQNLGAKEYGRIRSGLKAGLKMVWTLCIPVVALYFFCSRQLMGLFLDSPDSAALTEGATFLKIVAPAYFVIATKLVSDGVLRGSGMMREFMIGTLSDMVVRVVLVYILAAVFGSLGIWLAWPFSFFSGTALSLYYYSHGVWKDAKEA